MRITIPRVKLNGVLYFIVDLFDHYEVNAEKDWSLEILSDGTTYVRSKDPFDEHRYSLNKDVYSSFNRACKICKSQNKRLRK